MKKFLKAMIVVNIFIVINMLTGCGGGHQHRQTKVESLDVVQRDGCEYIVSPNGYGSIYSHKGNCKNKIHVYARKEEEDNVEVKQNRENKRKNK